MKVEVKPIPKKPWHGTPLDQNFKRPVTVQALVDTSTRRYNTGLTEEEQEQYGRLLGVDLSNKFIPDQPHPFYSGIGKLKLENHTMILDTDNPFEYVMYALMKASPFVANTMKDYEEGKADPDATHYIHSEEEEMSEKASKISLKRECIIAASKLTANDKINAALILSDTPLKSRSNDYIDVTIDKIINSKPIEFINLVKMDKADLNLRGTILDGLRKNVLTKQGTSIEFNGEFLGHDLNEAVAWFKDPNNQKKKIAILQKINDD